MEQTAHKWESQLDNRQHKELRLAQLYAKDFAHGTTGHNQLMLIARLADLLNHVEDSGVDIPFVVQSEGK